MACLVFTFTCCIMCFLSKKTDALVDPKVTRNVSELITSEGYPVEEHTVRTVDGYLLSVQRIPNGRNEDTQAEDKEVVLLLHGELGDSKQWFLNYPGESLGYILPDAGYDVWLLNNRGSIYSQKNIYYPTRSFKFWNFCFEEMATYDVPATINYILNVTGKDDLYLIGYSRGNTVGFIFLSELPEYNEKVKLLVALAPVTYIGHFTSIIRIFVPVAEAIYVAINSVTQGQFFTTNKAQKIAIAKFCEVDQIGLCEVLIYAIAGVDREFLNKTRVPIYLAQYPSSTSTKNLLHYAQLIRSKEFRKFDYGPKKNLLYYNQPTPPDYPLERISAPVALFSSARDAIADTIDVDILRGRLNSIAFDYRVPGGVYNHLDFIWGEKAEEIIYKPLLEMMERYK